MRMSIKINGGAEVNILDAVYYFEGDLVREGQIRLMIHDEYHGDRLVVDNLPVTVPRWPREVYPDRQSALEDRRLYLLGEEARAEVALRRSRDRQSAIQRQIREL